MKTTLRLAGLLLVFAPWGAPKVWAQCPGATTTLGFNAAANSGSWINRTAQGVPVGSALTQISTGNLSGTGGPTLSQGALNGTTLLWSTNYPNNTLTKNSVVTFDFGRSVSNLSVEVQDIDRDGTSQVDKVVFEGLNASGAVVSTSFLTLTKANSASNVFTITGNSAQGVNATTSAIDGTVIAKFSTDVKQLRLTFSNETTAANPGTQTIGINSMSWCALIPVANNVTNAATILASAGQTDISDLSSTVDGTIKQYTITRIPTLAQGTLYYNNSATATANYVAVAKGQTLSIAQAASLRFDPSGASYGAVTFEYSVTDSQDQVSTISADAAVFTIPVGNTAPVATAQTATIVNRGVATVLSPLPLVTDLESGLAYYKFNSVPATGAFMVTRSGATIPVAVTTTMQLTPAELTTLTYTPVAGYTGTLPALPFTGTDNGGLTSAVANYTIAVTNTVPTATAQAATVPNDRSVVLVPTLAATDPENDVAYFRFTSLPTAAQGTLKIGSTPVTTTTQIKPADLANLAFTATAGFTGPVTLAYTVTDGGGLTSTAAAYSLTVAANQAPTALNVTSNPIANIAGATVLAPSFEGTDPENNLSRFTITSLPTILQGVLLKNGLPVVLGTPTAQFTPAELSQLVFVPVLTFLGKPSFTYTATDGSGLASAPATYTIQVVAHTIAGRVFEDVNYGGGTGVSFAEAPGAIGVGGARIELYKGGLLDQVITTATSGAIGSYSFPIPDPLGLTNYLVRVVSTSVKSSRLNSASAATLLPVLTYINGDGNRVGGEDPSKGEAGNGLIGGLLSTLTAATNTVQTITSNLPVTGSFTNLGGVDFGFSFDVVTNTNDAGQGSLRQFILNANSLSNAQVDQRPFNNAGTPAGQDFPAGVETSIFMIPDGTAKPGLRSGLTGLLSILTGGTGTTNSRALVTLASALPIVTDAATVLDGTTQSTLSNSNPTMLGTGGTVGTSRQALSKVAGPELEITGPASIGSLVQFAASNGVVRGLSLHGGNAAITVTNGASGPTTGMLIEQNVIGVNAFNVAVPTTNPTNGTAVVLNNAAGTFQNNVVAYAGISGLNYSAAGAGSPLAGYRILNNEFKQNGRTTAGGDNISVGDNIPAGVTGPLLISGNLLASSNSSGIQFEVGKVGDNVVTNNTIFDNGNGGLSTSRLEGSGIHYLSRTGNEVSTNTDLIQNNIIYNNQSSGIVLNHTQSRVQISQNSIYQNGNRTDPTAKGLLSIDFTVGPNDHVGGNVDYGQGDGVTANDGEFSTSQPNGGIDYPVITSIAKDSNGKLRVQGYIGTTADLARSSTTLGQAKFGGALVEIYSANNGDSNQDGPTTITSGDMVAHGEAQNYIGTLTADPNGNFDYTFPSVANTINNGDNITSTAYLPGYGTSEAGTNQVSTFVVLPVELVQFAAKAVNHQVQLTWSTASEKDNNRFEVERSLDGQSFEQIGKVAGHGTSSEKHSYAFVDNKVSQHTGLLYYRLRQVDQNGKATYSPVRTVTLEASAARFTISPNPTNEDVTLDLTSLPAGKYHVSFHDVSGRQVGAEQVISGGEAKSVNVASFPAGVYIITVQGLQHVQTQRLVKY
jgi:hypothetical protein